MELREVEKFRPIPKGGLNLLLGMFATFVLAANGMLLGFFMYKWIPNLPGNLEILPGVLFVVASSMGTLIYAMSGSRRKWVEDYWRRNVRGYNAWYWRDRDWQNGETRVVVTQRGDGEEKTSLFGPGRSVVKIPLGGWFNSSGRVHGCNKTGEIKRSRGWRLKRLYWCMDGTPRFFVSDGYGEGLTFILSDFLDFLEWDYDSNNWSIHTRMLHEVLQFRRERDEAKKRVEELGSELSTTRYWLDRALSAMDRAIVEIKNTSRFGKSKEAKRIREQLAGALICTAPPDHPLRERYWSSDRRPTAPDAAGTSQGG